MKDSSGSEKIFKLEFFILVLFLINNFNFNISLYFKNNNFFLLLKFNLIFFYFFYFYHFTRFNNYFGLKVLC